MLRYHGVFPYGKCMSAPHQVELITLGDELLNGVRANGHLTYLGGQCSRLGLELVRAVVIRDEPADIERAFAGIWDHAGLVITTGGLGPTRDDLTRETLARLLGRPLQLQEDLVTGLRARFDRLGRTMTENNLRQCYLPAGATAIANHYGTAPGIYLREGSRRLIMLPGPAPELIPMWEEQVVPMLTAEGLLAPGDHFLQLRTCGIGESALETLLGPVLYPHADLRVAWCAHEGMVDLRLSPAAPTMTADRLRELGENCRGLLGEGFVCFGEDSLAKVVFDHLRREGKTLAVAESCTGGQLSDAFTNIPGASKVFLGGIVCYNNDTKIQMLDVPECLLQQHGAVSGECAVAMVTGAAERLGADYALSITGFAGPGGGTPENPVGTIFLGFYSPVGVWSRRVVFSGERLSVKQRAVHAALDWLRRKLGKYRIDDILSCHCRPTG